MGKILNDSRPSRAPKTQSPIIKLVHRKSGGHVTLVGVAHVGQPDYYARIEKLLISQQEHGAAVHDTRLRRPGKQELAAVDPRSRKLVEIFDKALEHGRGPYRSIGLITLHDIWSPDPGWVRHELTMLDAVNFFGPATVRQLARSALKRHLALSLMTKSARRDSLLRELARPMQQLRHGAASEDLVCHQLAQFKTLREDLAMEVVDAHRIEEPGAHIAMVGDPMSMPAFCEAFRARGYLLLNEIWETAVEPVTL